MGLTFQLTIYTYHLSIYNIYFIYVMRGEYPIFAFAYFQRINPTCLTYFLRIYLPMKVVAKK